MGCGPKRKFTKQNPAQAG